MAYDEFLADRIQTLLSLAGTVEKKLMFSGLAFMVNGKMCINVVRDGIMCRVDPALHDELVELPGCSAMEMKGRSLRGWLLLSPKVLRTQKQLNFWVTHCVDFNSMAKDSRKTGICCSLK